MLDCATLSLFKLAPFLGQHTPFHGEITPELLHEPSFLVYATREL